jgi:hypothetical protein
VAVDDRVRWVVEAYSVLPPVAAFAFPWDDRDAPDPVVALSRAREELGDTFVVRSGATTCVFTFGEIGLRNFYALGESDASKGVADYRVLVRTLPARRAIRRPVIVYARRAVCHGCAMEHPKLRSVARGGASWKAGNQPGAR